jgi:hypothetical protein
VRNPRLAIATHGIKKAATRTSPAPRSRVVKLKSLEERNVITVGTFDPAAALMEFRLGRQRPKTALLPAYVNFGKREMNLTLWAPQ